MNEEALAPVRKSRFVFAGSAPQPTELCNAQKRDGSLLAVSPQCTRRCGRDGWWGASGAGCRCRRVTKVNGPVMRCFDVAMRHEVCVGGRWRRCCLDSRRVGNGACLQLLLHRRPIQLPSSSHGGGMCNGHRRGRSDVAPRRRGGGPPKRLRLRLVVRPPAWVRAVRMMVAACGACGIHLVVKVAHARRAGAAVALAGERGGNGAGSGGICGRRPAPDGGALPRRHRGRRRRPAANARRRRCAPGGSAPAAVAVRDVCEDPKRAVRRERVA